MTGVVRQLQRAALLHGGAELTDRELLDRYVSQHDEAAFAELVRRHGPMVLGVCRRVLGNAQDAEDAFQATFLVLVHKAATVRPRGLLGNWLYGVAHNTALKANAMRRKRLTRERQAGARPRPDAGQNDRGEVQELLDEELSRLPDKYRVPIVLCELEGKTLKEAARQLDWPQGTLATRLRRGRALLAERLARRGQALPAGLLAAPAVSDTLLDATLVAASHFAAGQVALTGLVSPAVAALTEGVLKNMLLRKLKVVAAGLFLVLAVGALAVLPALPRPAHSAAPPLVEPRAAEAPPDDEPEPVDFAAMPLTLIGGHDVSISVAFSPDGKRIAAGMGNWDRPGRVQVWDFATRKPLWSRDEPRGVFSVAFSADSKRLAWSGWIGRLCIDQVAPRRQVVRLPLAETNYYVAFSRDRKWLALASEDHSLRLLEADTGKQVALLKGDASLSYFCVAFSHDSKLLAAGGGRWARWNAGTGPVQVNLFDVGTRKQVGKLTGHGDSILKVVYAPKDDLIATASADGTIRLWDGKTFKLRSSILAHQGGLRGLAFSPDGSLLVSAGFNRILNLWGPAEGKLLGQLGSQADSIQEIAFAPDGRHLVSVGDRRIVNLWDVKERKLLDTLHEDSEAGKLPPLLTMAVSPDGKLLATGTENGEVLLRDSTTGAVRQTLNAHEDAVTALVFSPDGKYLASGGPDRLVRVWEPRTGKPLRTLKGHTSWVYALAFSRDGRRLASAGYDKAVRLWEPGTGKHLGTLSGHKGSVRALAFSPDGKLLASGGSDKRVRLWEIEGLKSKGAMAGHEGTVRGLAFAPSGQRLASAGEDGQLRLWDPLKGEAIGKLQQGLGELQTLIQSPAGVLIAGSQGGAITLAEGATGAVRRSWKGHTNGVLAVAVAPGSPHLYSLGGDGLVKLWRGTPAPLRQLTGHTGPVRVVCYSPNGKYLLSCSGWPEGDRTLRLWDVKSGKQVRILMTGKTQLRTAAFSPDSKYAVTGDERGIIYVIEVETGNEVRTLRGHKDTAWGLTFSRDGKWLLSAGVDKTVRLWDARTGDPGRVYKGHTDWALCGLFHPDGRRIITGGRDGVIRVWDRDSGKELKTIDADKEAVERLALLPDGKRLLSAGGRDLRLWDLESGKEVRAFPRNPAGVNWLALTKDGRTALTTSFDGSTRLWNVETGAELRRYGGHRNWARCVDIAPDGRTFATAGGGAHQGDKAVPGQDFTIRVWKMPALP
jgi:RNA polymerase sigma factor (sigma-70 family)